MLARESPPDRRSGDNGDFPFRCVCAMQLLTEFSNDGRLWFVGINDRIDELKEIGMRGRTLHRHNAHTLMTNNNLVAFVDVEELDGPRGASFLIHRNGAIHHGGAPPA